MKNYIAILMILLMASTVYSRERRHSVTKTASLRASLSSLKASATTDGTGSNDSDDDAKKTGDDDNEMETDDTDTDDMMTTDNDDNDSTDMKNDSDDEADDMDDDANTTKTPLKSAQKTAAAVQLTKSQSRLAASLDAQQSIKSIANAPTVDSIIAQTLASTKNASNGSGTVAANGVVPSTSPSLVAAPAAAAGKLTTTTVPEPTTALLIAAGWLALLCTSQRSRAPRRL
jgi:FtsZ-interacting cell division protein ZipA